MQKEEIAHYFKNLQDAICSSLEGLDGKAKFQEDNWERPGGGGGRSRVIQGGDLIEKGGVNFSAVHGDAPERMLSALKLGGKQFFATGVSIVLHPASPMVPIIHMNVRYFEMSDGTMWFGGGIDLTPHYVVPEDAAFFHKTLKETCDRHNTDYYERFRKWADDYFYIRHRSETRGIGGIFFDRLAPGQPAGKPGSSELPGPDKEALFAFVKDVGETFVPVYSEIANRRRGDSFGEREKTWQMLRRGRYVEFNLVWDKGTKFGLDTDGRTESILMSLPPVANWEYAHTAEPGSREEATLSYLKKGIDWTKQ
ncbi:oxygen-dependent coproporphyrinogen oxidase [Roseivirga sp. BDSF3-8]|uniref:oxygen-dependent coproporphyrinogen oxidase n=1 Tax=Roseivirga sp. BDSF3-8 TaxID=3241598 RepID=UPI003531A467